MVGVGGWDKDRTDQIRPDQNRTKQGSRDGTSLAGNRSTAGTSIHPISRKRDDNIVSSARLHPMVDIIHQGVGQLDLASCSSSQLEFSRISTRSPTILSCTLMIWATLNLSEMHLCSIQGTALNHFTGISRPCPIYGPC